MKKFLRLSTKLIKMNVARQMAYRFNFFWTAICTSVYLSTYLLAFKYIFDQATPIGGYGFEELAFLVIMGQLWMAVYIIFVRINFIELHEIINNGLLDIWLLKPLKLMKYSLFYRMNWTEIFLAIVMFVLLAMSIFNSGPSIVKLIGFIYFFMNALWLIYSVTRLFVAFSFWVGRNKSFFHFSLEIPMIAQIPVTFFPTVLKFLFVFLFPIIPLLNPGFQLIYNDSPEIWLLWSSFLLGPFFHITSRYVWKRGLKVYSSAN